MLSYFRSLCRAGFFTRVFRVSGSVESTYAEQLKKKNNLKKKTERKKRNKKASFAVCLAFTSAPLTWIETYKGLNSPKNWTPKQHNKTAQPKADKYPTYHYSPFNFCLSLVLYLEKWAYPDKNSHVVFFVIINSVLLNLLCVWALFWNASSHSCFRYFFTHVVQ